MGKKIKDFVNDMEWKEWEIVFIINLLIICIPILTLRCIQAPLAIQKSYEYGASAITILRAFLIIKNKFNLF